MFKRSLLAVSVMISSITYADPMFQQLPKDKADIIVNAAKEVGNTQWGEFTDIMGLNVVDGVGYVQNNPQIITINNSDGIRLARWDDDGKVIIFSKEVSDFFFNAGDTSTPATLSLEDNKSATNTASATTTVANNKAEKEAPKKEVVENKPSKPATKPVKPSDMSVFEPLYIDGGSSQELMDKEKQRKEKARVTPGYREFPLAKAPAESQPIYSSPEDPLKDLKPKVMVGEVFQVDDVRYALERGDWKNGNLYFKTYDPYSGTESQLFCFKGYGTTGNMLKRDGDSGNPICRHFNKDDRYYRSDFPVKYIPEPTEITRETTWYPYNLKRKGYVFYKGIRYNVEIDDDSQLNHVLTLKAIPLKDVDDPSLDHLPFPYQRIKEISVSVSCTKAIDNGYYRMAGANSDNTPEPDPKQDNIFRELGFVIDYPDKDFCLQAWEAFYN
jgi:hypothetical protein|nr:MAG TPA: hypothetical protein [Caudoviricetes sp.]